jgi:hypothetical protein
MTLKSIFCLNSIFFKIIKLLIKKKIKKIKFCLKKKKKKKKKKSHCYLFIFENK